MERTREILNVAEVAAMLKMSKWSIYNKVRNRELPAHQQMFRGRLFFFRDEIQQYEENLRIRPMTELNKLANRI